MKHHFIARRRQGHSTGFTLIELLVSISLMLLIILAVALVFQGTSKAVGTSEATMDVMSNMRSVQQQVESDIAGIDKNCFLIIRPGTLNGQNIDQMSFVSYGSFPNRTGGVAPNPFTDSTVANAAFIWWGQLFLGQSNQSIAVPQGANPTGVKDSDFILGRNPIILISQDTATNNFNPAGQSIPAYKSTATVAAIDWNTATFIPSGDSTKAHISQSRVSAAGILPSQLHQMILKQLNAGTFVSNNYCYRFGALRSVYDSGETASFSNQLINGTFRMHPIVLPGVSSFKIEWTTGAVASGLVSFNNTALAVTFKDPASSWPKALKITYHVADSTGRLAGGRDFVQIVKIPD